MKSLRFCSNCRAELPAESPQPLCPKCLQEARTLAADGPSVRGTTGAFAPPQVDALSSLFPQLEILGLLGAGGMGAVYRARQRGLDRLVALKILSPDVAHGN